ncbi:MAG TPA: DedA family protein [Gaiellaceae bacterium]|nr:DedA family protein [Gaiellaceae bacterium]
MFDRLVDVVSSASGWAYAVVVLVALVDALLPLVPSETAVITAGVLSAAGELSLPVVVAAAASGAMIGDNAAYLVGRRLGGRIKRRLNRSERRRSQLRWAERRLAERGGELIALGRFIPGGRTAVTLSAGMLPFRWRAFVVFDALAALGWALYASMLGFFGGEAFEKAPWKGLVVAIGIAFSTAAAIELVRWYRHRRATTGERMPPADDRRDGR